MSHALHGGARLILPSNTTSRLKPPRVLVTLMESKEGSFSHGKTYSVLKGIPPEKASLAPSMEVEKQQQQRKTLKAVLFFPQTIYGVAYLSDV